MVRLTSSTPTTNTETKQQILQNKLHTVTPSTTPYDTSDTSYMTYSSLTCDSFHIFFTDTETKQQILQQHELTRDQSYDFNGTLKSVNDVVSISPSLLATIRVIQACDMSELDVVENAFRGEMIRYEDCTTIVTTTSTTTIISATTIITIITTIITTAIISATTTITTSTTTTISATTIITISTTTTTTNTTATATTTTTTTTIIIITTTITTT